MSILIWIAWGYLAFVISTLSRRMKGETPESVYKDEDIWDYMLFGPFALFFSIVELIFRLPWKNTAIAIVETIMAFKNKEQNGQKD